MPGRRGRKPVWYFSWPVAVRVAKVRPWKEPVVARISPRPRTKATAWRAYTPTSCAALSAITSALVSCPPRSRAGGAAPAPPRRAGLDLRADAARGEHLEQHRMPHAAVDHVGLLDAAADRLEAALDLGDHPAGD